MPERFDDELYTERWERVATLFADISSRYEEALDREKWEANYIFVNTGIDEATQSPVALFSLVDSYANFNNNRGEVLRIGVPTASLGDKDSGLLYLSPESPTERFVTVKYIDQTGMTYFRVTYDRTHIHDPSGNEILGPVMPTFEDELLQKVRNFKIVLNKPYRYIEPDS